MLASMMLWANNQLGSVVRKQNYEPLPSLDAFKAMASSDQCSIQPSTQTADVTASFIPPYSTTSEDSRDQHLRSLELPGQSGVELVDGRTPSFLCRSLPSVAMTRRKV